MWTLIKDFFGGMETQLLTIAAVVAVLAGGYFYWQHLENKITNLQQQNTILQSTVQTQNQTITQLQQRFKQIQQDLADLNKSYAAATLDSENLKRQLDFGIITPANKNAVETQNNQLYNSLFQSITQETTSFTAGK